MPARHALLPLAVSASLLGIVVACNAIVGVEDVKLKKDGGGGDDVDIIEDPDVEEPPTDQSTPPTSVLEVTSGEEHTCAKKADGTVKCWGHDDKMQTGTTAADASTGVLAVPSDVTGITDALHISAGQNHTCIVRKTGTVSCWGDNIVGQLGDGNSGARSRTPVDVVGISNAVAVDGGATFSCAVKSDSGVACWGSNAAGQLGNGSKNSALTPVAVTGLTKAVSISAGDVHACAVTSDGRIWCWGNNENGQLGNNSNTESLVATMIPTLDDMVAVSASSRTTCALRRNGEVYCWGANELGQLGTGAANVTPNPSPSMVGGGLVASAIATGRDHACALKKAGGVVCWGAGDRGQLGNGSVTTSPTPMPVDVNGSTSAVSVSAGGDQACAPQMTGKIQCWGAGTFGQLGENNTIDEATPVTVIGYP